MLRLDRILEVIIIFQTKWSSYEKPSVEEEECWPQSLQFQVREIERFVGIKANKTWKNTSNCGSKQKGDLKYAKYGESVWKREYILLWYK